jgi:hypothetical protein
MTGACGALYSIILRLFGFAGTRRGRLFSPIAIRDLD